LQHLSTTFKKIKKTKADKDLASRGRPEPRILGIETVLGQKFALLIATAQLGDPVAEQLHTRGIDLR
jgi:hypothetical protein